MNQLEEYQEVELQEVELQEVELQEELLHRQRLAAAEKRRKRKLKARRRKFLQAGMLFAVACICVLLCVNILRKPESNTTYYANLAEDDINTSRENTKEKTEAETDEESEEEEIVDVSIIPADYSSIEFRDESKYDRYDAYRKKNPDLSLDEVVWQVNANLDKTKYEYDIPTDGYDDPYIIVNKFYKVPENYRPDDLENFDGHLLRRETGNAYRKMRNDAKAEGYNIYVVSGYRSVEYQRGLYNSYLSSDSRENVDRYSARPGYSEHHTGMAMDIFGSKEGLRNFENTPEYPWVRDNCYKYGFIIRYLEETEFITGYEAEPWHLRYVGVEVSTDMKEKGIKSFEEYHVKYLQ